MPTVPSGGTLEIREDTLFFFVFMVVIFSWILIDLWGRWINNFTFITLGLNPKSSIHTFIIAMLFTVIIIAALGMLKYGFGIDYEIDVTQHNCPTPDSNNSSNSNSQKRPGISIIQPLTTPIELLGVV